MESKGGDGPGATRRRKLFYMAKTHLGLTDDERIDLAQYLLRRDITSWKDLTDEQVGRLLDAMEGWLLIQTIYGQRP